MTRTYLDLVSATPGARVLATVLPGGSTPRRKGLKVVLPPVPSTLYPPGEVVARFTVSERAVPWSVTMRGKAKRKPKLVAWQGHIAKAAREAMAGCLPHSGGFELRVEFHLQPMPSMPDSTNLLKSTEDACQGIVFTNDRNARRTVIDYENAASENMTTVEVVAL